jgi:hypothetical protein
VVIAMPSGGARARSGPAPDPNALRRGRKTDAEWTTLPAEGFKGRIPTFPLTRPTEPLSSIKANDEDREDLIRDALAEIETRFEAEKKLWKELWRKPQAAMWHRLGMKYQVAAYVRAFLESTSAASSGLKTAVLRMEGELGLSVPGMNALRWKIAHDELAEQREPEQVAAAATAAARPSTGARARLRVLDAD